MINSLEKLEIVKEGGEAAQILGGWPSPPSVAKCVRTIFKIEHHSTRSAKEQNFAHGP
jgi:hypothetical protein